MKKLVGLNTKYSCDRCGKEFAKSGAMEKPNNVDCSVKRGASFPAPIVEKKEISFQTKDLCGPCVVEFTAWVAKKEGGSRGKKT